MTFKVARDSENTYFYLGPVNRSLDKGDPRQNTYMNK